MYVISISGSGCLETHTATIELFGKLLQVAHIFVELHSDSLDASKTSLEQSR